MAKKIHPVARKAAGWKTAREICLQNNLLTHFAIFGNDESGKNWCKDEGLILQRG
jgi:hypothetical protein